MTFRSSVDCGAAVRAGIGVLAVLPLGRSPYPVRIGLDALFTAVGEAADEVDEANAGVLACEVKALDGIVEFEIRPPARALRGGSDVVFAVGRVVDEVDAGVTDCEVEVGDETEGYASRPPGRSNP